MFCSVAHSCPVDAEGTMTGTPAAPIPIITQDTRMAAATATVLHLPFRAACDSLPIPLVLGGQESFIVCCNSLADLNVLMQLLPGAMQQAMPSFTLANCSFYIHYPSRPGLVNGRLASPNAAEVCTKPFSVTLLPTPLQRAMLVRCHGTAGGVGDKMLRGVRQLMHRFYSASPEVYLGDTPVRAFLASKCERETRLGHPSVVEFQYFNMFGSEDLDVTLLVDREFLTNSSANHATAT
jgi:hypothetical protein